ncbi:16S rRNA (guanine(527)-N(7))-methyltransferase RsmG [Paracoccus aurantiacus]|uniref:Ribosomal RNA small subunit methyltransferase G n=1 Tax=Paracoccus aurantiacus TaxID=2599412 RepID=A0A5C6S199_9RHOB|nr:16S rRNA (guanine(527)-N(7))-methyltransferase RsmG [Paracoccus aurantiacus]TXB67789.1 16S rRNA (guanine(527)-N(7))-methyltransferase RsmG [Paracoccus aurantiacus]
MDVSRETEALLSGYSALVKKWNPTINLVAPQTVADFQQRHIRDSAQLYKHAKPHKGSWIDLGSGGGLPGIVIAILAREHPVDISLVESDARKSAFLSTCKRELGLPRLTVKTKRIEALARSDHDFASARALAPLQKLLPMLFSQLASTGEAWLLKGRSWRQEVEDARTSWSFDLETYKSATDTESVVMKLRNIEPNA